MNDSLKNWHKMTQDEKIRSRFGIFKIPISKTRFQNAYPSMSRLHQEERSFNEFKDNGNVTERCNSAS